MDHLQTMTDDELSELATLIAAQIDVSDRRSAQKSKWPVWISIIGAALAIMSLIFTVGVNWGRITEHERRIIAIEQAQRDIVKDTADTKGDIREIKANVINFGMQLVGISAKLDRLK